jgi:hypothetical protein
MTLRGVRYFAVSECNIIFISGVFCVSWRINTPIHLVKWESKKLASAPIQALHAGSPEFAACYGSLKVFSYGRGCSVQGGDGLDLSRLVTPRSFDKFLSVLFNPQRQQRIGFGLDRCVDGFARLFPVGRCASALVHSEFFKAMFRFVEQVFKWRQLHRCCLVLAFG